MNPMPESLRGYQRAWLVRDVIAGLTLSAVAIPEVMGYTSIAQTPIVTGVYSIILQTPVFALLGSSRLLVVGADSATAAILAAGLAGIGVVGLTPYSQEWLAWCSLVALICGVLLILARLLKLGFIGNFLSASVLVGFLSGVGISVLTGQIPSMLGVPKSTGTWLQQQWGTITSIPDASAPTLAFALGTVLLIVGFKRFLPVVPGAVVAVILSIVISAATDAQSHGVAVIGSLTGGFPPVGLPTGLSWSDIASASTVAFACFVLIIAQSAATSRGFAGQARRARGHQPRPGRPQRRTPAHVGWCQFGRRAGSGLHVRPRPGEQEAVQLSEVRRPFKVVHGADGRARLDGTSAADVEAQERCPRAWAARS